MKLLYLTDCLVYNNMNYNDYKEKYYDMKKTVCAILAAAAIGLTLVSCNDKTEDGYKKIESATCEFSYEYPEDWVNIYSEGILAIEKLNDPGNATIVGHSFERDAEELSELNEKHAGEDYTAANYWEDHYFPMISGTYGEANIVQTSLESVDYKDTKQAYATYTKTIGEDVYNCQAILILAQDRVFTLTLTQQIQNKDGEIKVSDYKDVLMKCLESFEIKRGLIF